MPGAQAMTNRVLSRPPAMSPLHLRAGAAMIPGASRLPFIGGGGGEVPGVALTLDDVAVDRDRLAAYDRVCGFDVSDVLPATYPHALAFGMQLALMTSGAFPVPAIGLVHIANRIVVHRPIDAAERLSLKVWATPLYPHPRGRQFMVRTEARVGDAHSGTGELVWEEASLNLRRGARDDSVEPPTGPPDASGLAPTATWRLPGDLGRRYGAAAGDLNPIHLHPLSAKLFGFDSAIAHGMWTLARCLAQLGAGGIRSGDAYVVEAAFKRPIALPGTVRFAEARTADGIAFGVSDGRGETQHLDGLLTAAKT